jgi:hypothetical protein
LVVASFYACIHRDGHSAVISTAVADVSGWHPIDFLDIDPAGLQAAANCSLHHFMHIYIELDALDSSPSPSPPFLASIPWTSQISTQRPLNQLRIVGCITLCMYPSRWALWSHLHRRRRRFWLAPHGLLKYRPSRPRSGCKLVVASFYACIRRYGRSAVISATVADVSGWHPVDFSDIDPAAIESAANHRLHHAIYVSVKTGTLESSPPFLAGIQSTS